MNTGLSGEHGLAVLRVLVSATGDVKQVSLLKSSGDAGWDKAARDAVSKWRFVPAMDVNKKNVDTWVRLPIKFEPGSAGAAGN